VGIGNIYANEALFKAGILPTSQARNIDKQRMNCLAHIIKKY
jgi:formamidopyrimidine-DNA glycosylase